MLIRGLITGCVCALLILFLEKSSRILKCSNYLLYYFIPYCIMCSFFIVLSIVWSLGFLPSFAGFSHLLAMALNLSYEKDGNRLTQQTF